MTAAGGSRRRRWRWAVGVWVAAAVAGGALTLWLQDTNGQAERPSGGPTPQESAAPLLSAEVDEDDACPRDPDGGVVLCIRATGR
ncbi:hypothetical protein JCM4814A_27240 [Streptomyces phaeofaciens JCM 4814]|uniref:Uncharacterized protein n=1 Tax=Streptomyces phaeofaciens TaxID=68254 RepID=A0A918H4J8_9ACTN|nr:hypothetical protein GCM10010226_12570 [Streptomyces phaeofaciens]